MEVGGVLPMLSGPQILTYLSLRYEGDWDKVMEGIRNKEELPDDDYVLEALSKIKSKVITILDSAYPLHLKESYKPPLVLFYYGNIELISSFNNVLSVVGSRDSSKKAFERVKDICYCLANNEIAIVSGLAKGIDTAASLGSVKQGKAIVVLGSGIDYIYPSSNSDLYREIKEKGLILSEYPGKKEPNPSFFPTRNRIIVSLGKALLVGEVAPRSGTMVSINLALTSGKDVGIFPKDIDDPRSYGNRLIKEGAILIENCDDVMEMMGIKSQ